VGPEVLLVFDDETALTRDLRQAALSIHFIGGADDSALLAIERSVEVCPGPTIVCQSPGVQLSPEESIWLTEFERGLNHDSAARCHRVASIDETLFAIDRFVARS
jgi:hypothetical protein